MAIAFVQEVATGGTAGSATSLVLTLSGVTTTVGNHLILRVLASNTGRSLGVTDSKGNTWQIDRTGGATAPVTFAASTKISSALVNGDTITITWTGGSASTTARVTEFSGLATSGWYDQGADAAGTGTAADSGATGTLAQADSLIVGQVALASTVSAFAWESLSPSWNDEGVVVSTTTVRWEEYAYRIVSATTAVSAKATWTTSRAWHSQVDVYKAAAGGGGGVTATPGVASLALTPYAPTVSTPRTATPGVKALSLTTFAPSVNIGVNVIPGVGALTLTTYAPTVATTANQRVTPGVKALTLTGLAPTVTASNHKTATPGVLALALTTFAPTVTASTTPQTKGDVAITSALIGALALSTSLVDAASLSDTALGAVALETS